MRSTPEPVTDAPCLLKVDAEALSPALVHSLQRGEVNLDDPAVTAQLVQANAVLGVVGFFDALIGFRGLGSNVVREV